VLQRVLGMVAAYLKRFSELQHDMINCGPVLSWLEVSWCYSLYRSFALFKLDVWKLCLFSVVKLWCHERESSSITCTFGTKHLFFVWSKGAI